MATPLGEVSFCYSSVPSSVRATITASSLNIARLLYVVKIYYSTLVLYYTLGVPPALRTPHAY